ncbi:hypothetical protein JTB14_034410 [Gonioctena quinquepunctata]|nr:hypothetical protein JTB14_034410 [Gonioctena quinquepunctata]
MIEPMRTKITEKEIKLHGHTVLHDAMGWTIFVYQIFGFMPIDGILQPNIYELKFSWFFLRTVYSLLTICGLTFMTGIQVTRFFVSEVQMADVMRLLYFMRSLFATIYLLYMATYWQKFLRKWNKVDKLMSRYGMPEGLRRKVNWVTAIFMALFLVDYILVQLQRIQGDLQSGRPIVMNIKTWNHFQKDLKFQYVYELVDYSFASGMILVVIQIQVLLAGTFVDLFIMIISLALASRITQVTERIKLASECKTTPDSTWKDLREDYNILACLCKFVNRKVGPVILLSFAANLGILLILLFNSLNIKKGIIGELYLYYAFLFLLSKTVGVCILGAKVNDGSRKPLMYLYSVPAATHNVEIDRLIRQIIRDDMALSGMNFFHIRRNIILKIAGSIVTYELVLMQFAGDFLKEHEIANRTYSL